MQPVPSPKSCIRSALRRRPVVATPCDAPGNEASSFPAVASAPKKSMLKKGMLRSMTTPICEDSVASSASSFQHERYSHPSVSESICFVQPRPSAMKSSMKRPTVKHEPTPTEPTPTEPAILERCNRRPSVTSTAEVLGPLTVDDHRPETWSSRGLCRRAYYTAAQRELWRAKDNSSCPPMEEGSISRRLSLRGANNLEGRFQRSSSIVLPSGGLPLGSLLANLGGAVAVAGGNPLKELVTAKKIDVQAIKRILSTDPKCLEEPLAPDLPRPLVFALGTANIGLVTLLLEAQADAHRCYEGKRPYMGWVRPGASPIEAVRSRVGRFVGTMLGERLETILQLLRGATREEIPQASPPRGRRKSVSLAAARGVVEHTQGHPSEKYDVVNELEEGTLGCLREAICRDTGKHFAIKAEMKMAEGLVWEEIALLRQVCHPNVIGLFETFEDETHIFLVLDLCTGGELFGRLAHYGGLPQLDAARIMHQQASAVWYIHSVRIAHRNIQAESFLLLDDTPLTEVRLKLVDFTAAKDFATPMFTKVCTLPYVAPEILKKKDLVYTEKVDVWSLGVVFFVMLCGFAPFQGESDVAILKRIKRGSFKFNPPEVWANISEKAKHLLQQMLVVDADHRFSAVEVMSHPWMDWEGGGVADEVPLDQLLHLRKFHACSRMQKCIQKIKLEQLPEEAVSEMRSIFQELDIGEGVHISLVRDKIVRAPCLRENIEEIMRLLWKLSQSGAVTFPAFLEAVAGRRRALQKEGCRAVFAFYDFDGTGTISRDVFRTLLRSADVSLDVLGVPADIENRLDLNDEHYSFEHFFDLLHEGR